MAYINRLKETGCGSPAICLGLFLGLLFLQAPSAAATGIRDTTEAHQQFKEGSALQNDAEYAASTQRLREAAEQFLAEGYSLRAAQCYNEIAFNYRALSRMGKARAAANRALELSESGDSGTGINTPLIYAYYNLAKIEGRRTNFAASDSLYRVALDLAGGASGRSGAGLRASILSGLGSSYDDQGKYEQARGYYRKAIQLLQPGNPAHWRQLVDLYNYIGVTYAKTGKYELALDFYNKQQELNHKLYGKSHPDVAGVFINIGAVYYRRRDIGEAIEYFKKGANTLIEVFGKNHPGVGLVYNNIGECYVEMGRYEEAVSYLKESVAIKSEIRGAGHPDVAIGYNNIGQVYTRMGNVEKAREYIHKALAIRKEKLNPFHPRLADTYHSLGQLSLELGQPDSALIFFHSELNILEKSLGAGHPRAALAHGNIARAHRSLKQFPGALRHIEDGLASITPHRYPQAALDLVINKARALHEYYSHSGDTGHLEKALKAYSGGSNLMDRLQTEYRSADSKLLLARRNHEIAEEAIEMAYTLFRESGSSEYLHDIYRFAEQSKSRVIREQMKSEKAKHFAGIPDSLIAYEQDLREQLAGARQELNAQISEAETRESRISMLKDSVFALNRRLNGHLAMLKNRYPHYHRFMYSPDIPSVSEIRETLGGNNTAILEYFYGNESLWAIIISERSLEVQKLPFDRDLVEKINRLNTAIRESNAPEYTSLAHELYKTLIPPSTELRTSEHLLIVPDGALNLLPFETLLEQPVFPGAGAVEYAQLPYLIHSHTVSYAPAVSMASSFGPQAASPGSYNHEFTAFAPVFSFSQLTGSFRSNRDNGWEPLPSSEYEVRQIAGKIQSETGILDRLLGSGNPVELFVGEEASEQTFKLAGIESTRFLHLATHAYVADSSNAGSGISFYPDSTGGEDGLLYDYEIYNLNLNSELVVLSACETGAGKIVRGEGIIGLSRAFQYAGAQNLLVSLWNVDDRATARLMIQFYGPLLEGAGKARALRQAKLGLINGVEYAHPRYWAPFVLIGS